ncbi:Putative zinc metalloprotease Rip3 [Pontiella desulfatans]|uniref:Zinc metalloprotease Rip3 n=1 Tax=Pontiella desulfatans TaxID=2750659 RepID=A0A6C2U9E1_PONDE|nr:M50 family metallopeptidase [Pontiella desulfatans]VGO16605.1 Putative zinc metalloprotease Rip3 [Pontiella desulfatans]
MKMVNNALSVGSVLGIPIRLHISLLIAVGVISFMALAAGINPLVVPILAIGLFGSVALHELGHSVVARAKGSYIQEIVLYPFGGAAKISNLSRNPVDEILVAAAGPAVSLVLALLLLPYGLTYDLGRLNMALFFFNILPVFPMDGGRVLRAALTIKHGRLNATRTAAQVAKYFCGLFVIIGLFGLPVQLFGFIGPFRPSLMLAFIGGYIYMAGQQELRMVLLENQANRFSGFSDGQIEVEVSPPPYANRGNSGFESLRSRWKNLFRG